MIPAAVAPSAAVEPSWRSDVRAVPSAGSRTTGPHPQTALALQRRGRSARRWRRTCRRPGRRRCPDHRPPRRRQSRQPPGVGQRPADRRSGVSYGAPTSSGAQPPTVGPPLPGQLPDLRHDDWFLATNRAAAHDLAMIKAPAGSALAPLSRARDRTRWPPAGCAPPADPHPGRGRCHRHRRRIPRRARRRGGRQRLHDDRGRRGSHLGLPPGGAGSSGVRSRRPRVGGARSGRLPARPLLHPGGLDDARDVGCRLRWRRVLGRARRAVFAARHHTTTS